MNIIKQAVSYGLIGIINTFIGLSIIYSLMLFINASYMIANIIGYIITLFVSFFLNRKYTFKIMENPKKRMFLFFMVFIISYVVQFACLRFFKESLGINPYLSQAMGILVYTTIGFFLNKYLVFKEKRTAHEV